MGQIKWPTTIDQAVDDLMRIVPDEAKDRILKLDESEVAGKLHFSLGLWIRNNFGLTKGNKALLWQIEACGSSRLLMYFPHSPDYLSSMIIKAFWKRLHETI